MPSVTSWSNLLLVLPPFLFFFNGISLTVKTLTMSLSKSRIIILFKCNNAIIYIFIFTQFSSKFSDVQFHPLTRFLCIKQAVRKKASTCSLSHMKHHCIFLDSCLCGHSTAQCIGIALQWWHSIKGLGVFYPPRKRAAMFSWPATRSLLMAGDIREHI